MSSLNPELRNLTWDGYFNRLKVLREGRPQWISRRGHRMPRCLLPACSALLRLLWFVPILFCSAPFYSALSAPFRSVSSYSLFCHRENSEMRRSVPLQSRRHRLGRHRCRSARPLLRNAGLGHVSRSYVSHPERRRPFQSAYSRICSVICGRLLSRADMDKCQAIETLSR